MAARLCAREATEEDLERIVESNDHFMKSIDSNNAGENVQADIDFHMAIVKGAHSVDLEKMIGNLSVLHCSMRLFALSLKVPSSVTDNLRLSNQVKEVHQPILNTILGRDLDRAEIEARKHVEKSLERNRIWIKKVNTLIVEIKAKQSEKFAWRVSNSA